MKVWVTFIFFVLAFTAGAQEVKKIVNINKAINKRKEFYVLKADPKVKNGPYTEFYGTSIIQTGFFKNNLRDSTWIEYFPGSKFIIQQGNYHIGKKIGIWHECIFSNDAIYLADKGAYQDGKRRGPWKFYNQEGEITRVFDYSLGKLLYQKQTTDTLKTLSMVDNKWERVRLDQQPFPIMEETDMAFMQRLTNKINYPIQALRNGIEGEVLASFSVNEDGTESDYEIFKSPGQELNAETLRVLKIMARKWEPGKFNGKPVKTRYYLPIVYKIN